MDALNKKSIEDIDVRGKKCLVRCDFNVPLNGTSITNDKRIVAALPTIKYLIENGAKVILCSHLGRPKGQYKPEFSLAPVAERLSEYLDKEVKLAEDKEVVGHNARTMAKHLEDGEVMLLENVRFRQEETSNAENFSRELASLADIFVNDAFGTAHRAHCSTTGVAAYLPAVCGFLIQKEIEFMGGALANPERPLVAILGGAKVSDKIGVITNLLEKCDTIIIGGGMAYTFMKYLGHSIGTSLLESDWIDKAGEMMKEADKKGVKFLIPIDNKVGKEYSEDTEAMIVNSDEIPDGWMGLDIGPATQKLFVDAIKGAGTVIWNGPMGVSEWKEFEAGTVAVAKAVADSGAISIIGGGDSVAAVTKLGFADKMSHISTGGGASLEFLEGKELPGIVALNDK
ncbi:MAG: phosphoglycerate kinase [Eubacterium sp.]|nr:phosphoglycerate kinase [Eubacterium sp.]